MIFLSFAYDVFSLMQFEKNFSKRLSSLNLLWLLAFGFVFSCACLWLGSEARNLKRKKTRKALKLLLLWAFRE